MLKRNKKKNNGYVYGIICFCFGIFVCLVDFGYRYYECKLENYKVQSFIYNSVSVSVDSENNFNSDYIGVLEIPKIELKVGFYDIDCEKNDVDKGIEVLEKSNMPDVVNGSLILASHSGNSKIAYFNKLDELLYGDSLYVYYNKHKYEYKLVNIYEVEKKGSVLIKEKEGNSLVLITCSRKNKNMQVVYVSELVDVVN